jgi:DNA-binding response OmpR family regulator
MRFTVEKLTEWEQNSDIGVIGRPAAGVREKGGRMKRILVVDDDPLVTKLVKINLELSGYTVEEAWDGDSAIKVLEKNPPDLLVLDLMMPRTDGWDILRLVREQEALKELPVILLTAKVHDEDLIRGWEMGADDYVTKPFNPIRLSDHVSNVLESTPGERQDKRRRELVKLTGVNRADARPESA